MEKTFKTKEGTELKLPTLPNFVSIESVLGMKLSKPMVVAVKDLTDDAIGRMARAWGEALIERKNKRKNG